MLPRILPSFFLLLLAPAAISSVGCRGTGGPLERPLEGVIAEPSAITAANAAAWKKEGFGAVAVVLDEDYSRDAYQEASRVAATNGLDLLWWIEVGRSPALASAHPDWMASLGMHDDWRQRFPGVPPPAKGEVAKAFPWVPIFYREAFEGHLARIAGLLERAGGGPRRLLLNDLQGGPASCGCGNLQCRWALDYGVPATGSATEVDGAAARFLAEVRKVAGGREIIPVWTTECQDDDLPPGRRAGAPSSGYCGTVPCSQGACPQAFARQWSSLLAAHDGPIGLLALHREFGRDGPEYAVRYLDEVLPKHGIGPVEHRRRWLVIEGYGLSAEEINAARRAAAETGAGAVFLALARIDQSYEPRLVHVR